MAMIQNCFFIGFPLRVGSYNQTASARSATLRPRQHAVNSKSGSWHSLWLTAEAAFVIAMISAVLRANAEPPRKPVVRGFIQRLDGERVHHASSAQEQGPSEAGPSTDVIARS